MKSIGIDIVDVSRIANGINRFGERYIKRILGPQEIALLEKRHDKAQFLAGRFAAKEAIVKALGRFLKDRPPLQALQIINDPTGQPEAALPEAVQVILTGHTLMISITHEKNNAAAVAVILEDR